MVKAFGVNAASAAIGLRGSPLRRKPGTAQRSVPVLPGLVSGRFSAAHLHRARSISFRLRLRHVSTMDLWSTGLQHGRPAGMTIARGAIPTSTRTWVTTLVRTVRPISGARGCSLGLLSLDQFEAIQTSRGYSA